MLAVHTADSDSPRAEEEYLAGILQSHPSVLRQWRFRLQMIKSMAPDFVEEIENRIEEDA